MWWDMAVPRALVLARSDSCWDTAQAMFRALGIRAERGLSAHDAVAVASERRIAIALVEMAAVDSATELVALLRRFSIQPNPVVVFSGSANGAMPSDVFSLPAPFTVDEGTTLLRLVLTAQALGSERVRG